MKSKSHYDNTPLRWLYHIWYSDFPWCWKINLWVHHVLCKILIGRGTCNCSWLNKNAKKKKIHILIILLKYSNWVQTCQTGWCRSELEIKPQPQKTPELPGIRLHQGKCYVLRETLSPVWLFFQIRCNQVSKTIIHLPLICSWEMKVSQYACQGLSLWSENKMARHLKGRVWYEEALSSF